MSVINEVIVTDPQILSQNLATFWNKYFTSSEWNKLIWSPELKLLVAVLFQGNCSIIQTSPNGMNWKVISPPQKNCWSSVTWAVDLGLFVAVSFNGVNRVITSPDGINWTLRNASAQSYWIDLVYARELGLLVALASTGETLVMVSNDAINWVSVQVPKMFQMFSLAWSPELSLFVAIGFDKENKVLISPDGTNWTVHSINIDQNIVSKNTLKIVWSKDLGYFLIRVKLGNNNYNLLTSTNGIDWVPQQKKIFFPNECVFDTITWSKEFISEFLG